MGMGLKLGLALGRRRRGGQSDLRAIGAESLSEAGTATAFITEAFATGAESASEVGTASGNVSGTGTAAGAESASEVGTATAYVTEGTAVGAESASEVGTAAGADTTAPTLNSFSVAQVSGNIEITLDVTGPEDEYFLETVFVQSGESEPDADDIDGGLKSDGITNAPFWINGFGFDTNLTDEVVAFDRYTTGLSGNFDCYAFVEDASGNRSSVLSDLTVAIVTSDAALLETGDNILLETGDRLLLEA